ncbi:hypothetical protein [Aliamphritea spongicola]|uniref:hypothetical protein n=1 Tax=Aliamphritea spongicola TaxID=707589 RepID=UPI00196A7EF8|nr:hypothetical protein [Aliamphritea spongicola]MBN3562896.1 hypothetical protein [Aliamphritea spongicola]
MSVKTTQPVQAQTLTANSQTTTVIDAPIVAFKVLKHVAEIPDILALDTAGLSRPQSLAGTTYEVITPRSEHPLYVTINDLILNPGTDAQVNYPWEIFVNTRTMDHFMWVTSLNQIISGVFDQPAPLGERLRELYGLFDQHGQHLKQGGRFTPALASELGEAIFGHFKAVGLPEIDCGQPVQEEKVRELPSRKRREDEAQHMSGQTSADDKQAV